MMVKGCRRSGSVQSPAATAWQRFCLLSIGHATASCGEAWPTALFKSGSSASVLLHSTQPSLRIKGQADTTQRRVLPRPMPDRCTEPTIRAVPSAPYIASSIAPRQHQCRIERKRPLRVMVGNGMAGVPHAGRAAQARAGDVRHHRVRRRAASQLQPHPALAGAGRRDDAAGHHPQRPRLVRDNGITLHAGKKVTEDRPHRAQGHRRPDGTEAEYDRLLLATGSTPFILPVPGKDLPGVIAYRDIADTEAMIEAAQDHRHAVVIGAGLLGLEAANGLRCAAWT
jgi:hypothetical protein